MIDTKTLDDLAGRLAGSLPAGLQTMKSDMERGLRSNLETALSRMDLVTREEFDVQSAVLARTREKLHALEQRVAELEQKLSDGNG